MGIYSFQPVKKINPEDTDYWNKELGKIFNYRFHPVRHYIRTVEKLDKTHKRIRFAVLQNKIDKVHKEWDPKGFKRYQELKKDRKILLITTGGTILCKTDTEGFLAPTLSGIDMFQRLNAYLVDTYNVIEETPFKKLGEVGHIRGLSNKGLIDSADIPSHLQIVLARYIAEKIREHEPLGVVVLHGTDTMASTAAALSFLFKELTVPVILTGSMIPGEEKGSDAIDNLKASFIFAAAAPLKPGVYVCFGKKLFQGTRVIHDRTEPPRNAFNSVVGREKGCCGRIFTGCWFLTTSEGYSIRVPKHVAKEADQGEKTAFYSPNALSFITLTERFYQKRSKRRDAEVIGIEETGSVLGITTFPPTKKDLKKISKIYGIDLLEELKTLLRSLKRRVVAKLPRHERRSTS